MLAPGKHYVNAPISIPVNFKDTSGNDVDPTTVTLRVLNPWGSESTYVYGTDSEVTRSDAGDYVGAFTPDLEGRWHYRWQTTGTGTTGALEGNFLVQVSAFYEEWPSSSDYPL